MHVLLLHPSYNSKTLSGYNVQQSLCKLMECSYKPFPKAQIVNMKKSCHMISEFNDNALQIKCIFDHCLHLNIRLMVL